MIKKNYIIILLIAMCLSFGWVATGLQKERNELIEDRFLEYTIPSQFLKPLSLEFKGIASDFLLAKFMVFLGGRTMQLNDFSDEDWKTIGFTLDTITDLDPYYWDAYLFAQVFLTWDEKHYEDANRMLLKAREYISDDYRIPYYIGLNYYRFGNDSEKGSQYIMEASKLPGSPYYLANLAARLAAYSSEYERGIIFLKEMLTQAKSQDIAEQYNLRIIALERMHSLDQAVSRFKEKYNRLPLELQEMMTADIIQSIPEDPYGGEFYISDDGRIATTSKMVKRKKSQNDRAN